MVPKVFQPLEFYCIRLQSYAFGYIEMFWITEKNIWLQTGVSGCCKMDLITVKCFWFNQDRHLVRKKFFGIQKQIIGYEKVFLVTEKYIWLQRKVFGYREHRNALFPGSYEVA